MAAKNVRAAVNLTPFGLDFIQMRIKEIEQDFLTTHKFIKIIFFVIFFIAALVKKNNHPDFCTFLFISTEPLLWLLRVERVYFPE